MTEQISKCKCGVKAEIDWTAQENYPSGNYQMCILQCMSCETDASVNINTDKEHNSLEIEEGVIALWNLINKQ